MRTAWGIRYFKTQEKKAQALLQLRQFAETIGKTSRDNQQAFLSYAQRLLRENFIYNLQEQRLRYLASFEQEFSSKFSPYIHESNVLGIMQCFSDAQRDIAQNVQSPLVFCDLGLRLILLLKPE
jgi:DNA polymerase-3 subunit delta'